ncbi:hypothetical protein F8S13_18335 [Chloroflexia bacterium SDU3-3]|nr:hypothetical protein F8S13_18335 [Chloroflexia bacterium SDU3-3]
MQAIMRTDEHHIEKHRAILAIARGDVQAIFLGDSLTRRWEDNPELWERYFSRYRPANLGVGSDRLEHIKWRVLNGELDGFTPKTVVILAGTNNLDSDDEQEIVDGIGEIVAIVQEKLPAAKVVLLGLLPRNRSEGGVDYMPKIARINRQLGQRYASTAVAFHDLGDSLVNLQGAVDAAIMPDGLHLNAAGYAIIGPRLQAIIGQACD